MAKVNGLWQDERLEALRLFEIDAINQSECADRLKALGLNRYDISEEIEAVKIEKRSTQAAE